MTIAESTRIVLKRSEEAFSIAIQQRFLSREADRGEPESHGKPVELLIRNRVGLRIQLGFGLVWSKRGLKYPVVVVVVATSYQWIRESKIAM